MSFIFLDRDGVINRFPGFGSYVTRWEEFEFLPKAIEAIALLTKQGHELFVVSNQGCVAHGLISSQALRRLTRRMCRRIEKGGGKLAGVFYCEHRTSDDCDCKKPGTRLLEEALKGRRRNDGPMVFVGDSEVDVEAGKNFGCRTVLVLSGRMSRKDVKSLSVKPDFVKKDLWDAANWILKKKY